MCELSRVGPDDGTPRTRVCGVSWVAFVEGGFYHGGDVFTESLSCGLLLNICRTVVRLRSTCVTVSMKNCMSVEKG